MPVQQVQQDYLTPLPLDRAVAMVATEMGRPVRHVSFTYQVVNGVDVHQLFTKHQYDGDRRWHYWMTIFFDGRIVSGLYVGEPHA